MQTPIKIAQFGPGPIGIESIRLAATKPWAQIVGGIDIDPAKANQSRGTIARTSVHRHCCGRHAAGLGFADVPGC